MIKMISQGFKPELLPNNKAGIDPDWETLLEPVSDYICSVKDDGIRITLFKLLACGRSLKKCNSIKVNEMAAEFSEAVGFEGVMEAEFYSPNLTFPEIMHFYTTEDVASDRKRKEYAKEWEKTKQGTSTYTKTRTNKKTGLKEKYEQSWEYPGRDVEWLSEWPDCLGFHVFSYLKGMDDIRGKAERYVELLVLSQKFPSFAHAKIQTEYNHIDQIYQAYDQAILDGAEGLVVYRKSCVYKFGRHTLNSGNAYKIKEDNLDFDGVITDVEEATKAREGAAKTTNELGRSVTSKLQEDREPAGYAKGFLVDMGDGRTLIVSLKDYTVPEKRNLLITKDDIIGKTIRFTGMAPVKEGGVPRHAHFTKGNFREEK